MRFFCLRERACVWMCEEWTSTAGRGRKREGREKEEAALEVDQLRRRRCSLFSLSKTPFLSLFLLVFRLRTPRRVQTREQGGPLPLVRQARRTQTKRQNEHEVQKSIEGEQKKGRRKACVDGKKKHQSPTPADDFPPFSLTLQDPVAVRRRRAHVSRARRATAVRRHGDEAQRE